MGDRGRGENRRRWGFFPAPVDLTASRSDPLVEAERRSSDLVFRGAGRSPAMHLLLNGIPAALVATGLPYINLFEIASAKRLR